MKPRRWMVAVPVTADERRVIARYMRGKRAGVVVRDAVLAWIGLRGREASGD